MPTVLCENIYVVFKKGSYIQIGKVLVLDTVTLGVRVIQF